MFRQSKFVLRQRPFSENKTEKYAAYNCAYQSSYTKADGARAYLLFARFGGGAHRGVYYVFRLFYNIGFLSKGQVFVAFHNEISLLKIVAPRVLYENYSFLASLYHMRSFVSSF